MRRPLRTAAAAAALAVMVVAERESGIAAGWRDWSLIDGATPVVLAVLAAAGLVVVMAGGTGRRWWLHVLPVCGLVCAGVVAAAAVAVAVVQPWPDPLPELVWVVLAAAVFAIAAATTVVAAAVVRRRSWRRAFAVVAAAGLVVIGAAGQVNTYFGQFPTPRALLGLPPPGQVDFTQLRLAAPGTVPATTGATGRPVAVDWRPPAGLPGAGVVSQVAIPVRCPGSSPDRHGCTCRLRHWSGIRRGCRCWCCCTGSRERRGTGSTPVIWPP